MDDSHFMKIALALAENGKGFTSPNPMVGAVVVKDGRIVGEGFHEAVGKAHAEVNAIDNAGEHAEGATLFVTLEPCNHTGRTPPCTEKILKSGIQRVVVAMADPNPHVTGGGVSFLKQNGVDVTVGVCESEAIKLNEAFIKFVQTNRPFVILKCAMTWDGWIATRTGDSKWVSNAKSRTFVHHLRHTVDAIMVGVGTVNQDNPQLTARIEGKKTSDPIRIILDSNLSISPTAQLLDLESNVDTWIITGDLTLPEKKSALEKPGVKVLEAPLKNQRIDLDELMNILGQRNISSVLIEGGGGVAGSALRTGIVDKALFFYGPKIYGGDDGVPACRGKGTEFMTDCIAMKNIRVRQFDDDVMFEGYIEK